MDKVKRTIGYWCDDTRRGVCAGKGIGVAILDTGISYHPDFDQRIIGFQDMRKENKFRYDMNGHGTHVAGIIGGSGKLSNRQYSGIAPCCNLIMVRVLDEKGDGEIATVIEGIRWVRKNKTRYNIRILNISVGTLPHYGDQEEDDLLMEVEKLWDEGVVVVATRYNIRILNISVGTLPHYGDQEEDDLLMEVEKLWDEGVVVVAAAGNFGPAWGTITTPGISKKIITVGASNDEEESESLGKLRKNYSGRGPTRECVVKPDLVAPGSCVISCNGRYQRTGRAYIEKSGTSMSAPVVAGAIAILLSKYPSMSNLEVKLRLRQTCVDLGLNKNRQGWGMLHVKALLELIAILLSKYPSMSNLEVKLRLRQTCVDLGLNKNRQGWGMLHVKALLEL